MQGCGFRVEGLGIWDGGVGRGVWGLVVVGDASWFGSVFVNFRNGGSFRICQLENWRQLSGFGREDLEHGVLRRIVDAIHVDPRAPWCRVWGLGWGLRVEG